MLASGPFVTTERQARRVFGATLRKILAVSLATLGLLELLLHGLAGVPAGTGVLAAIRSATGDLRADQDRFWKERFLRGYDERAVRSLPISQREYRVDAELGWVPRPNLHFVGEGGDWYTTNSLGFRALREYTVDDAEHYTVLVVGDSFTYGSQADDGAVWPTLLQGLDPRLQVLNMGVGGYGLDQMYLMLRRHIGHFRPDLVVAAFIDDDLERAMLSFRDFEKPRFEIREGRLVLTNTPVPGLRETAERVRRELGWKRFLSRLRLLNLVRNSLAGTPAGAVDPEARTRLNDRLVGAMRATCTEQGAGFLLVYLPRGRELRDRRPRSFGEEYFEHVVARGGLRGLDPRPRFLAHPEIDFRGRGAHYGRAAATVVAQAVYERIRTRPDFPAGR